MSNLTGIDFLDVCPIQEIRGKSLVNGNGDVTFGFRLSLPEAFTLHTSEFNKIYEGFNHLLHRLKAGTLLHQQSFFYVAPFDFSSHFPNGFPSGYHTTKYTQRANQRYYTYRPIVRQYSNLYVTFSNQYTSGRISPIQNAYIRSLKYVARRPFKGIDRFLEDCRIQYKKVKNSLNAIPSIKAKPMDDVELLNSFHDYFNLSYDNPSKNAKESVIQPMDFGKNGEYFKVGNQFVKILSLAKEGKEVGSYYEGHQLFSSEEYQNGVKVPPIIRLGSTLPFPISLGLPINHILNVSIEVLDNEKVMFNKKLDRTMLNFLSVFGIDSAIDKQEDLTRYIQHVSLEEYRACRTAINVILNHSEEKVLNQYESVAENGFGTMKGAYAAVENRDTANLFFCSCPGNMKQNYRTFHSTTEQSVNYFHTEGHYKSDPEGSIFTDLFGTPVQFNVKNPPKDIAPSNHAFLIGKTRSGKSFWIQGQIEESLQRGEYVFQSDIGNSSKNAGKFNNAKYLDLQERDSFGTNLFLTKKDAYGKYLLDDMKALFLRTILTMMWKRGEAISPDTESILTWIISSYYTDFINDENVYPEINTFFEWTKICADKLGKDKKRLFDFGSFSTVLESYLPDGAYGFLFNHNNDLTVHEPLVIYDLKAIENDLTLLPLVGTIMMQQVNEMMMANPLKDKLFVIDEAHKIFLSPVLARFTGYCYATQQKNGGRIYTCTQGAEDLEKLSKIGVANQIKDNTEILVMFDNQYIPKKREILDLTDKDVHLLKGMETGGKERRQFFIKLGKGIGSISKLFYYDVSPVTRKVYSSVGSEKAAIQRLEKKYGNIRAAINQEIENQF